MAPTKRARSAASSIKPAVNGSSMPCKAPYVNRAVKATGPVCRYGDEAKIAASIDGIAAA